MNLDIQKFKIITRKAGYYHFNLHWSRLGKGMVTRNLMIENMGKKVSTNLCTRKEEISYFKLSFRQNQLNVWKHECDYLKDPRCRYCKKEYETLDHIFNKCEQNNNQQLKKLIELDDIKYNLNQLLINSQTKKKVLKFVKENNYY